MKCFTKSTGHSWLWGSFGIHLHRHSSPPAHEVVICALVHICYGASDQKAIIPQLSAQPLRPQARSTETQTPNVKLLPTPSYVVNTGGRDLERQELQELKVKQNLADVLVSEAPVAVGQLVLWPKRTWKWRNGKHLKGRTHFVFFLGEGFSLCGWRHFSLKQMVGFPHIKYLSACKCKNNPHPPKKG